MLTNVFLQFQKIRQKNTFARNLSIASTWNVLGILVQFILSPIITHLFTPEQYGFFSVYSSIVVNLALVSSFRYSEAVIISDTVARRNNIIFLSVLLIILNSLIVSTICIGFNKLFQDFLGVQDADNFIYAIPAGVLLTAILELLVFINASKSKFFSNGLSGFLVNIFSRGFTISFGVFIGARSSGLVVGDLLGKLVGIIIILFSFKKLKERIYQFKDSVSVVGMKLAAYFFKQFPLFNLPNNLLSNLSNHLPIYFFQWQYTSSVVGSYALASSLLEMINRFLPYSVAGVFFPKAIELKQSSIEDLSRGVYKLFIAMFGTAFMIFLGVAVLSKFVFPILFGASWENAGLYASILTLHYAIYFIAISLADVYKVLNKQRMLFIITIISVIFKFLSFVLVMMIDVDENIAILCFSSASSIGAFIQIVGVFTSLNFKVWRVILLLSILLFTLYLVVIQISI